MPRKKKETLVHLDMDELAQTASAAQDAVSMQTLGDILKKERQKKHWDIEDVSKASCIKAVYIEALEKGHYYVFPAKAYAIGFLRTYAKMLKLNPEEMVALYHQETSNDKEEPLDMLVIEKKAALPSKKTLFIVILALILFYIVWYLIANNYSTIPWFEKEDAPANQEVVVTDQLEVKENPVIEEEKVVEEKVVEVKPVESKPVIAEISDAVYTAPIAFVATERVWVKIRDVQKNNVPLDKVMAKNEHYIPKVPLENLSISTGRGGVLDLYINGIRSQTFKKEDNTPLVGLTKD